MYAVLYVYRLIHISAAKNQRLNLKPKREKSIRLKLTAKFEILWEQ